MVPSDFISDYFGLAPQDVLLTLWLLIYMELPRYLMGAIATSITANIGGHRNKRANNCMQHQAFKVSVLIPCHNAGDRLLKTVTSLREQNCERPEIIVIDDGSTDETHRLGQRLQSQRLVDTFLSVQLRGGKSAALNLGFQYCKGDIIVSVDADTTFDRDSISALVMAFQDNPNMGAAGGNVAIRNAHHSTLTGIQSIEYLIGISLGRSVSSLLGVVPVVSGAFAAFRRAAIECVGGWEPGPGEDADITFKIRSAGYTIGFVPTAWALTDAPESYQSLLKQRLRWDTDMVRIFWQKYRHMGYPWHRNFSLQRAASWIDIGLFSVALPISAMIWTGWILARNGAVGAGFLLIASFIYSLQAAILFLVAHFLMPRRRQLQLLPFVIGYGAYQMLFILPIRLWAIVDELLFCRSRHSDFVPKKVSRGL